MAKAIVCIGPTSVESSVVRISYTVSVIGPPNYSYSSDYIVNTGIGVAANFAAWQNKIIAQAVERGVTLITSDVITFGAPS